MQIFNATSSQALNASAIPQELRSRDALKLFSSAESVSSEQELQSSRNLANRDRVTLSAQATELSRLASSGSASLEREDGELVGLESDSELVGLETPTASGPVSSSKSEEVQQQKELEITRDLAKRDREVRAHEQAHAAIGGQYTSAPSYTYERGPDGRLYAVAGEVKIDTSPIPNDPQATLEKAEIIQRAALGVAEPSPADRAAAAEARAMAAEARAEIVQQQEEERVEESRTREENAGEDDGPTAGERLQELRDQREARSESAAESLNEFNDRLNDINKQLAEINKKLVDAGVFQKLFPEGSLLDQQI